MLRTFFFVKRRSGRTCKTWARADWLDQRPTGIRCRHGRRHGEDEGMKIRADFIREAVHNNNNRIDKANLQITWGTRELIKFTLLEVCRHIKCGQSSFCYYWDWLQNDQWHFKNTKVIDQASIAVQIASLYGILVCQNKATDKLGFRKILRFAY